MLDEFNKALHLVFTTSQFRNKPLLTAYFALPFSNLPVIELRLIPKNKEK